MNIFNGNLLVSYVVSYVVSYKIEYSINCINLNKMDKLTEYKFMESQMTLTESPEKFSQVNFYHLKQNYKYIITEIYGVFHYVGIFSHYQRGSIDIVIFKNVTCINPVERSCGYVSFSYQIGRRFYTIVSKKKEIQEAMESRALKKILKKITGDDLFEW